MSRKLVLWGESLGAPSRYSASEAGEASIRLTGDKNEVSAATEIRLRLLVETGVLLAAAKKFDNVADVALRAGMTLCQAACGAFLRPAEPAGAGSGLEAALRLEREGQTEPGLQLPTPANAFGEEAGLEVIRVDDLKGTTLYPAAGTAESLEAAAVRARSYLAVPIREASGELLGVLQYGSEAPAAFDTEAEAALRTVARQAATALEQLRRTERLERQLAAAEAEANRQQEADPGPRLAYALEAAGMGTWRWDLATDLIDFDERAAELLDVVPGMPFRREDLRTSVVHAADLAFAPADLRQLSESGSPYSTEYRLALPDGEQRWVGVRGISTRARDGRVLGMIGTVQDVTLRKVQDDALRTSEKLAATGRMAATIAHEINNPLEAVTNLIYLAKTDPETPESISRMLETADGELARVSQIAQQTLGFYRDTTRPVTIDVNELLTAVVDLFDRKLTGKGLRCTLDLEPGLSVVGLQGEIRQVVANLLVNAIDASPSRGGRIRIRGRYRRRHEARGIAVLICDEGEGIPLHVRRRLFKPFVTTKQTTGTGLGLWVTRGMVEKHGGSVCFRSRTVTPSGTVFRIFLPQMGGHALFPVPSSAAIQ